MDGSDVNLPNDHSHFDDDLRIGASLTVELDGSSTEEKQGGSTGELVVGSTGRSCTLGSGTSGTPVGESKHYLTLCIPEPDASDVLPGRSALDRGNMSPGTSAPDGGNRSPGTSAPDRGNRSPGRSALDRGNMSPGTSALDRGNMSPGRSSPDPCSICLGRIVNKSFTDSCLHEFCFICIKQWSKVKPECPLCKQNFKSIYYNVRTNDDYEKYELPQYTSGNYLPQTLFERHLWNLVNQPEYFSVPLGRSEDEEARPSNDFFFGVERSVALRPVATSITLPRYRNIDLEFRRNIYQQGLWVCPPATGHVRPNPPEWYRTHPESMDRLTAWLRRELNLLCSDDISELVLHIITNLITSFPIRSHSFANFIGQYLGRHTQHFLHEFHSFANSPYDLRSYDRYAVYVRDSNQSNRPYSPSNEDVQVPTIDVASDSDDCVIIDSPDVQASRAHSPEVITLESDDEVNEDNSSTNYEPLSEQQSSCTVRCLKRKNMVAFPLEPKRRSSLNVSININLPGPSHGRAAPTRRRSHLFRPPPGTDSSDSDLSPDWTSDYKRPSKKMSKKSPKSHMKSNDKDRVLKTVYKKSSRRDKSVVSKTPKQFLEQPVKSLREQLLILNSSSDDEPVTLKVFAKPERLAKVELVKSENKALLKNVTNSENLSDLAFNNLSEVTTKNLTKTGSAICTDSNCLAR